MADTYTLISSVTVGAGGASSIDFTSIPATYTDLLIDVSGRSTRSAIVDDLLISFNGLTASFSQKEIYGDGTSAASASLARYAGVTTGATATANTFGNSLIYIPNYAGSSYKSYSADGVEENNATGAYMVLAAGLWSNTAAITQVTLYAGSSNFVQYSTAYLYGIKNS